MSENSLIPIGNLSLPATTQDPSFLKTIESGNKFLPRVQLYGGNSEVVKGGEFPIGTFGLTKSKDSIVELGKAFDCLPLSWRYKAVRISPDDNHVSIFNPANPEFAVIQAEAAEKGMTGSMCGIEFLLYLFDIKQYATYYFSSASALREAPTLRSLIGQVATIKAKFIKKPKFSWHAPEVVTCSAPYEAPAAEDYMAELTKFNNPVDTEVVSVSAAEAASAARAR